MKPSILNQSCGPPCPGCRRFRHFLYNKQQGATKQMTKPTQMRSGRTVPRMLATITMILVFVPNCVLLIKRRRQLKKNPFNERGEMTDECQKPTSRDNGLACLHLSLMLYYRSSTYWCRTHNRTRWDNKSEGCDSCHPGPCTSCSYQLEHQTHREV